MRSLALRARLFSAISAAVASVGLRVSASKGRRTRPYKSFSAWPKNLPWLRKILYQPVLQRVVAHHHQPATGAQHLGRLHEHLLQGGQLIIYFNAQSLKYLRQIFIFLAARHHGLNGLLQLLNGA